MRVADKHRYSPRPPPRELQLDAGAPWRTLARIPHGFLLVFFWGNKFTPGVEVGHRHVQGWGEKLV